SIAGVIGAGKTTLANDIRTYFGSLGIDLPIFYEPVSDNTYLADFYKDKKKYSFPLQIYLMNRRYRQHQNIVWGEKGGIQDRTIYEDGIFAKVLRDDGDMDDRDYQTYLDLADIMMKSLRKPDVIIYQQNPNKFDNHDHPYPIISKNFSKD